MKYEIERAWELGKAVCGIYIDRLENSSGEQSLKGKNPLPSYMPIFETEYITSKYAYDDIKNNITNLVERAIKVRKLYK